MSLSARTFFLILSLAATNVPAQQRGVSSSPVDFIAVAGQVFFTAETRAHGRELWRTDGTTAGTRLVRDLTPGDASSRLQGFVAGEDVLYFLRDHDYRIEVWKSDGTESGTVLLHRGPSLGGRVLGATRNGVVFVIGRRLWVADGPHSEASPLREFSSDLSEAVTLNGVAYFLAADRNDVGVWRSDGTEGGTALHFRHADAGRLFTFRGALYFLSVVGGDLRRLPEEEPAAWLATLGSGFWSFAELGDWLFLTSSNRSSLVATLWKTDGTVAGTTMVQTLGVIRTSWLAAGGGHLFFVRQQMFPYGVLAVSDGTAAGTRDLASEIAPGGGGHAVLNGKLLFDGFLRGPGNEETSSGFELWSSDGTSAGTVLVREIAPGIDPVTGRMASSNPRYFLAWRDMVLFTANDQIYGQELWRTDGTAAGTRLVANIAGEGVVEGRISDAATGEPLGNVIVDVFKEEAGGRRFVTAASSDGEGRYRIDGLRTGAYQLRTRNAFGYVDQTGIRPVAFPLAPTTISGYDFALRRGGAKRRAIAP